MTYFEFIIIPLEKTSSKNSQILDKVVQLYVDEGKERGYTAVKKQMLLVLKETVTGNLYSQEEMFVGKKVSDFLKGEIISSIFYLAFGLCLILIPDQTVNIICKIIFGLVMIAAGIYHIVIYTAEKQKATILDLLTGVIVMVLGIFLFFTPQIVIKLLPYLLGAFVLVDSIWKIKGSYRLKKAERGRWKALLIGCLIFIALGISMLFYSFMSVKKMILFSGIILTANGVVDIVFLIMLRTGMKKSEKLRIARAKEEAEQGTLEHVDSASVKTEETDYAKSVSDKTEKTDYAESASDKTEKTDYAESVPDNTEDTNYAESAADNTGTEWGDMQEEEANTELREEFQTPKVKLEKETVQTADAADAEAVLEGKADKTEENVESPGREIREMLKNHDEPLEEWKD